MSPISILLIFFILANLPWMTDRVVGIVAMKKPKSSLVRLLEFTVFYGIGLLISAVLEVKFSGETHPQTWEFFVTTFCLFFVLAVPGIIYRHQWLAR